jgi:hypothetical protein
MVALRRHPRLALAFVLLSCADLALTCSLLHFSDGEVYEANGLAAEVLARYGQGGLAGFKALLVLTAGALVSVVAAYRPRAARRLAAFACVAVGGVVVYSVGLWGHVASRPVYRCQEPAVIERESHRLEQLARVRGEFNTLLDQWAEALAGGQGTVREATAALLSFRKRMEPQVMEGYCVQTRARSDSECLAAMVVSRALMALHGEGSSVARVRADQLLAEFQADHGPDLFAYLLENTPRFRDRDPVAVAALQAAPEDSSVESVAPEGRLRLDGGCGPREDRNRRARRGMRFVSARCPAS